MTTENLSRQDILDAEHLRLLSIFHYVRAGTTALIACIPLIHVVMGIVMIFVSRHIPTKPNEPPLAFIGWMFLGIGLFIVTAGWGFALLQFLVGRFIGKRQHRMFCLVISGINCLAIPYGTLAGVMTIIVLGRDSVRSRFEPGQDSPGVPPRPPPC